MLPQRIGRYEVSAELGRGATGIVYKGVDPEDGRTVAIKTLQRERVDGDVDVASILLRFRNEAQAIGRLRHPGVVAVHEFGEDELRSWIAMEYVDGRNLDELLVRHPLLGEKRTMVIMEQLLDALGCVHLHGICHRDVKPANIMLTATARLKLTDFGVARLRDAGLTKVSSVIGTPAFMAPEQFTGGPVDHRADLFACGVLLFRLLSGRRLFHGGPAAVMQQILHEEPPTLSEASGGLVGTSYDGVMLRALAKRADDRFSTAEEMREALRTAARQAGDSPPAAMEQTVVQDTGHPYADAPPGDGPASPCSADELASIERALARHVGPMARVILREAQGHAAGRAELVDALARQIHDVHARQAFIDGLQRIDADSSRPASDDSLPPALRAAAQQLLTQRLGPVASVLVKRAADQAGGSRAAFVANLLALTPEAGRAELRAALDGPQGPGR